MIKVGINGFGRIGRLILRAILENYKNKIRFEKATSIVRMLKGVKIESANNSVHFYDHVVIATHADEAFSLLKDPSESEIKLLSKWRYSKNC